MLRSDNLRRLAAQPGKDGYLLDSLMAGFGVRVVGIACWVAAGMMLGACPGRAGKVEEPAPPPFLASAGSSELGDPPAPSADKTGLAYLRRVYPALREGWRSFVSDCRLRLPPSDPLNNSSLAVTLGFAVARDGRLVSLAVAHSSGDDRFDAAAQEVVRDAAPFPAPPPELVSDDDVVHLAWRFARDQRLAGVATAEIELVRWEPERIIPKLVERGDVTAAAERLIAAGASQQPKSLVELGYKIAGAAVLEALDGEDKGVVRLALSVAATSGLSSAAPRALEIAKQAVDQDLRVQAIAALGAIGGEPAAQLLKSLVETASEAVRESTDVELAAVRSLAALGHGALARRRLVSRLEAGSDAARLSALAVLARFPVPEAASHLVAMIDGGDANRAAKEAACAALGTAATDENRAMVEKGLLTGLSSRNAAVRAACARGAAAAAGAGFAPGRVTYWKLVALLKDKDERVRAGALLAAARTDPKRFAKELYAVARDRSAMVKVALAEALGVVSGAAAYNKLAELAQSEDERVRRRAAAALLERPEQQARALLATLIDDPDPEVRRVALGAIDGVPSLTGLLDSDDRELAHAALARLVTVRGRPDTLAEVFARLARAPAASAARVHIAGAWLQP